MSDEKSKKAEAWVDIGGRPFHYRGEIREDTPEHILIFDYKLSAIVEIPRRSLLQLIYESQPAAAQRGVG